MNREEILLGAGAYFHTEQWLRLLDSLEYPHPTEGHIHCHVEGSLAIESLDAIVTSYFDKWGWPLVRRANHMCVNLDTYVLQGIGLKGRLNWELMCKWSPDAALVPSLGRESNCNLLLWGRHFMEGWYSDFDFRRVGAEDEKTVAQYFRSEHWQRGLELVLDRALLAHIHINVATSVHPQVLERIALEDLRRRGWEIDWAFGTVYSAPNAEKRSGAPGARATYFAKIAFLVSKPMQIALDLAWRFDPDVMLEADRTYRIKPDMPGYDIFPQADVQQMRQSHPWVILSQAEIASVVADAQLGARRHPN